jgi:nitrogen fixation protein FixH
MNIVVVGWNDTTATVHSVTDSAGNVYRLAIGPTSGTALRQSIYYAPNIAGGSNTVTVSFSQAAVYADIRVLEYRGVTALDVTAGDSGSGTSASSGSAATTSADELIFSADTIATTTTAAGSGFTERVVTRPDGDLAEDMTVASMGSYSATASLHSGAWVMQMATFSEAPAAASGVLSGLTCSNGSFSSAGSDACTVSLSSAAGAGGLAVSLSSNNSAVTVPATVTVAPGATSASFTAGVSAVSSTQTAVLTATAGGTAKTFTITLSGQTAPAPTVTGVSPSSGATSGGTAVTITGTNFASGATVTFGGAAASNVVVVNSTTITATTPAGSSGAVTVSVTSNGQSGSLANGFTYNAPAGIAFVQQASSTPQSATATVSVSYPGAQTAEDMNIVVVGWNDTTASVQSVTDSAGNVYRLAIGPTSGAALRQSIYYAANVAGGSNTVTVTFSQAAVYPDIRVLEYRGVTALDGTAGASGSGTSASSGSATTSSADELIFGADTIATTTTAAGSGFTARVVTTPDSDLAEDMTVASMGSYSATASLNSGAWVMQMATFSGAPPTAAASGVLSGLTCSNSSLSSAGTDACTVSLSSAAGTGGLTVNLSSNNSAVTVPASVTVAPGASSASFTASVLAVSTAQTAVLTATAGGTAKTFSITLNGAAAVSALTLGSTSISFGNVNLNSPATQAETLTSSGTSALTISAASVTGAGFSISGLTFPVTLNPGQSATLYVGFDPTVTGTATGAVTLTSNASPGTATVSLSGAGQTVSHQVVLTWSAPSSSSDPVVGYNVYRAAGGSSSYQLLNSSADVITTYTDSTVQSGTSYSYYVESVDASGNQSAPSNTYSVSVP